MANEIHCLQDIVAKHLLNNLVPKYLTQYFSRNADLHDHATRRRNDEHPPKPKRNMGVLFVISDFFYYYKLNAFFANYYDQSVSYVRY